MFNGEKFSQVITHQGNLVRITGRLDSVEQLPPTGSYNQMYLIGAEDATRFKKYLWNVSTQQWDYKGVSVIMDWDDKQDLLVLHSSGTSEAQEITEPRIPELYEGLKLVIIPSTNLSASPTLNINGLGAIPIKRRNNADGTLYAGAHTGWLMAEHAYTLLYSDGNFIVTEFNKVSFTDTVGYKHDSTSTTYGAGSKTNYGHVKLVNDLEHISYTDGEALAANVGFKLKNLIDDLDNSIGDMGYTSITYELDSPAERINVAENHSVIKSFTVTEPAAPNALTGANFTVTFRDGSVYVAGTNANDVNVTYSIPYNKPVRSIELLNVDSSQVITKYDYLVPNTVKEYSDKQDAKTLESAKSYTDKFAVFPFTVNSSKRVYLYDDDGLIQSAETLDITILTAQDKPVDFYISTGDTFSVPADTEKLRFDFKNGEAYKKSRTDLELTRYTDLDWLAGSETFKNHPGYLVYMHLQGESTAKVLYSYTAVVSVQYAVSQKAGEFESKEYTDTKAAAAEENAKTYGNQTFAGALKGEKLGSIVRLDDVSALDRRLDTVVSSKNIIPFPYAEGMSKTVNGVTFTVSDDGSITVNGTATDSAWFFLVLSTPLHVATETTYAIKSVGDDAKYNKTYWFSLNLYDSDGVYSESKVAQNFDTTFYVQDNQRTIRYISITVKSGYTANNIVIKPQIEEGTVSTAYTKNVSDLSGVSLKKFGKNLFHCYGISANSMENPGASCALSNAYGTTIDKTALSLASDVLTVTQTEHPNSTNLSSYTNGFFCIGLSDMIVGQNYTLSFTFNNTDDPLSAMTEFKLQAYLNGSKFVPWQKVSPNRFSLSFTWEVNGSRPNARYIEVRLSGMSGTFSAFQLEPLRTASAYVPWSAPETYTVGADGTVQNLSAYEDGTTLVTDNEGTVLKTKYSRDLSAAFTEIQNAIIALGGSF